MTAAVQFRGIFKSFRDRPVLRGVDLDVDAGEFFGLVGVNGAGKTTCIKALLDFCAVDGGEMRIFGTPHRDVSARAHVAYLPEQFSPPYYQTGKAFLRYSARLHGLEFDERRQRDLFVLLDLDRSALDKLVRDFSKGMAQKLGLLGCFMSGKKLLILDEPMSGLDPKARILVKRYLRRLKEETAGGRSTLFFSTHMLFDVEELCDRMAILHEGRLHFVGTPAECCRTFGTESLEQAYLACISGRSNPTRSRAES